MIENNPVFSVIICTYERYKDLIESIKSVLKQKFSSYEIIVVVPVHDKITISLLQKFPNVKIVLQEHGKGLSYARNLGISIAKGKYIAFLDDDAEADPPWLQNLFRCYNDKKIGAVGGIVISPNLTDVQFKNGAVNRFADVKTSLPYSHEEYNTPNGEWFNYIQGTNISFRRDLLVDLGGFNPAYRFYLDEADLCVRLIKKGFKIVHANDAVVIHKMSEGFNRRGRWDLNWFEIMKSTMIFCKSHFYKESSIKDKMRILTHPISFRLREFYAGWYDKTLSFPMLMQISLKVLKGYFYGVFTPNTLILNPNWIPDSQNVRIINSGSGENKNKLKICLVSQEYPPGKIGGIGRYTHVLAKKLAERGHVIHVVTNNDSNEFEKGILVHSLSHYKKNIPPTKDLPIVRKNVLHSLAVYDKVKEISHLFGIDIIEAPLWDIEGLSLCLKKIAPVVVRVETPLFKVAEINNWKLNKDLLISKELEKKYLKSANGIISISKNVKDTISKYYELENANWFLNYLGIDINSLKSTPSKTSNDEGKKAVLFVGRLEKRKGVEDLVKAIPYVLVKENQTKFYFIGSDTPYDSKQTYKDYLLSLIPKKFHDNVEFLNYVDEKELENYYSNCSVFVAPSIYESFGIVFLEAMKHAKPVIGTKAGGIPEIVENGKTGLLIDPNDHKELAKAILEILTNDEIKKRFGLNGKKRLESLFTAEKFAKDTVSIYQKVISKKKQD